MLEYLGEATIYGMIKRTGGFGGGWPAILSIARQVTAIVEYLHNSANLYQLDLKPGNLAVAGGNDALKIKLMDLGSAYSCDESDVKRLGTPGYIAPELFMNAPFSKSSDIFSLGVFLNELVTGENPLVVRQEKALGQSTSDSFDEPITAVVPISAAILVDDEDSDGGTLYHDLLEWMRTLQLAPCQENGTVPRDFAFLVRDLTRFQASERPSAQAARARLLQLAPDILKVPTIFISHAHKDKGRFVDGFVGALRKRGLDVWIDADSLRTGQPFWEEIGKAIQRSDFVILILSRNSVRSAGVSEELRTTQLYNLSRVKLLPIRIDPVDFAEIPHHIRSRHVLDFVGWESPELLRKKTDKLVSDIFSLQQEHKSSSRNVS